MSNFNTVAVAVAIDWCYCSRRRHRARLGRRGQHSIRVDVYCRRRHWRSCQTGSQFLILTNYSWNFLWSVYTGRSSPQPIGAWRRSLRPVAATVASPHLNTMLQVATPSHSSPRYKSDHIFNHAIKVIHRLITIAYFPTAVILHSRTFGLFADFAGFYFKFTLC